MLTWQQVRWRQLISREAASGSLDSFQSASWQLGAGTAETFSKIKSSVHPRLKRPNKTSKANPDLTQAYQETIRLSKVVANLRHRPRLMAHASLMLGIGVVLAGAQTTSLATRSALVSQLSQGSTGYGSTLDATAQAQVAANLATGTDMLISADASKTASQLTAQVALAGDQDTLAKRQVVTTAQPARHDITNYVVQSGDTLSQIAQKFNVTSDTIRWSNNLSNADSLSPGQTLKILPITGVLYTVQSGDTTASLASKFQANDAQIAEYNDADVKGLKVGQQIIIPEGQIQEAPKPQAAPVTAPTTSIASSSVSRSFGFVGGSNSYAWGNCTWYVANRRAVPPFWGDARSWYYNAQFSGYSVGSVPAAGAIAWTGAGYYGHVAYVESVSGGMVTISEMNYGGNFGRVTYRTVPASTFRYIY